MRRDALRKIQRKGVVEERKEQLEKCPLTFTHQHKKTPNTTHHTYFPTKDYERGQERRKRTMATTMVAKDNSDDADESGDDDDDDSNAATTARSARSLS